MLEKSAYFSDIIGFLPFSSVKINRMMSFHFSSWFLGSSSHREELRFLGEWILLNPYFWHPYSDSSFYTVLRLVTFFVFDVIWWSTSVIYMSTRCVILFYVSYLYSYFLLCTTLHLDLYPHSLLCDILHIKCMNRFTRCYLRLFRFVPFFITAYCSNRVCCK